MELMNGLRTFPRFAAALDWRSCCGAAGKACLEGPAVERTGLPSISARAGFVHPSKASGIGETAKGRIKTGRIELTVAAADGMPPLECLEKRFDGRAGHVRHPGEFTLRHVDERMWRPAILGHGRGSLSRRGRSR